MKNLIFFITVLFLALSNVDSVRATENISLSVETQEGSTTNLDFGSLEVMTEEGEPANNSSLVRVKVTSANTTGCQYKVTQRLGGPILNERNSELPAAALTFFTFGASTSGKLLIENPRPISSAEEVIFISDASGQDDTFQIQYSLDVPLDVKSGRYKSNLIYRIATVK